MKNSYNWNVCVVWGVGKSPIGNDFCCASQLRFIFSLLDFRYGRFFQLDGFEEFFHGGLGVRCFCGSKSLIEVP